jgi:hypothetical protein
MSPTVGLGAIVIGRDDGAALDPTEPGSGHDNDPRPVIVNLVLRPDVASDNVPESVAAVAEELGAKLTPQFAGTSDPTLSSYWLATTPAAHADEFTSRLLELPEVDGAYVKPTDEPA